MNEWEPLVQELVDYIEEHAREAPSLREISAHVGYSPCYCSEQFHRFAGMTIREYMLRRRLSIAAVELRDTGVPIIDIALGCGFSDQSTFTRAFRYAFGCAPMEYRRNPLPLPLVCRKMLLRPRSDEKGGCFMNNISEPFVRMEYIPAHRYLGVYGEAETENGRIWPGHDCELACGIISSFRDADLDVVVTRFTAGWTHENGERRYFFGAGTPVGYDGKIPDGFELRGEFPGSYYFVFGYPRFDYLTENAEVMKRVEELAWSFDPKPLGFEWNEDVCQDYQRHYPEVLGYQVLRPVRKIG